MRMTFNEIPTWKAWKEASAGHWYSRRGAKPYLVKIDYLIKQYAGGTSVRYPVLLGLRQALNDWYDDKIGRGAGSERWDAMDALVEVVNRKLKDVEKTKTYGEVVLVPYITQVVGDADEYTGVADDNSGGIKGQS